MRDLIHSESYVRSAAQIEPDVQRWDHVIEGVETGIANDAEFYDPIPGTSVRMCPTKDFPGAPALRVFYRIVSDDEVELIYVDREEPLDK